MCCVVSCHCFASKGLTEEATHQMTVANPARMLDIAEESSLKRGAELECTSTNNSEFGG